MDLLVIDKQTMENTVNNPDNPSATTQLQSSPKIVFIFKIKNKFWSKLFAPCPLYKITKSKNWSKQEAKLPLQYEYLYVDQAPVELTQNGLPIIVLTQSDNNKVLATPDEIQSCQGNALSLLAVIQQNLQVYS